MSNNQSAFTLLELLVALAIVGILTATAVPQYAQYKKRAFDARAQSDLRAVAIAEEAYYLDAEQYLSCQDQSCLALPGIVALSQGVSLGVETTTTGFIARANHPQGSGREYVWDSSAGGIR